MWELLFKSMKFKIGLIIFLSVFLLGIVGPFFVGDPLAQSLDPTLWNNGPSSAHILGTTQYGEDVFAQFCYGIRNSLVIGFLAGTLGTLIAVLVGGLGPYRGGIADKLTTLLTNLVIILPLIPLFIIIRQLIVGEMNILEVGVILGVTSWPWAARSIRSQVLTLKEREFINLARMSGEKGTQIVVKEVLPNMFAYIMMVFVILTGTAILAESALSMIGISASTSSVTLGFMLWQARRITSLPFWWYAWWYFVPPGVILTVLLTSIFVMHSGMDEVFNPRLREV
jgi:peptide/nickel transport system permease protein